MPNNRFSTLNKTISFSALESYINCPRYYEEKYIKKTEYEKTIESSLILGSWCHELIESKIRTAQVNIIDVLLEKLPDWLSNLNITLTDSEIQNLVLCVDELSELLYRASVFCVDKELVIRNKDNSVLKDPVNYPSSTFLSSLKKCLYYKYKSELDLKASKQVKEFIDISLSWTLAEALFLAKNFKIPDWVYVTKGIELGFGLNEDTAFWLDADTSLLGFIDWVVQLEDGSIVIIDHKTSKLSSKPSPLDVLYHPQLNLYAHVFEKITGYTVKYIGINHLRSGDIIIAEIDKTVQRENYEYILEVYNLSKKDSYIRRRPGDYNSPCLKKDYKSGRVVNTCPFINKCWNNYNELLNKGLSLH